LARKILNHALTADISGIGMSLLQTATTTLTTKDANNKGHAPFTVRDHDHQTRYFPTENFATKLSKRQRAQPQTRRGLS